MELEPTTMFVVSVAAAALAVVAIAVGVAALLGQRRVRRAYESFSQGSGEDVLTLLQRHIDEVGRLREDVSAAQARTAELRERIRGSVSQVSTVRYDAFEDMGGRLSFSTALLDEHGDGVVITAINGRVETRTYAKPVRAGGSRAHLSVEERTAVEQALAAPRRRQAARRGEPVVDEPADILPVDGGAMVRRLDADEPQPARGLPRAAEAS